MSNQDLVTPVLMKCDLQDYVEIACMFNYDVQLKLKSGESVRGKALTIRLNSSRQESLLLALHDNRVEKLSEELEIPLVSLREMLILTKNARFGRVIFE